MVTDPDLQAEYDRAIDNHAMCRFTLDSVDFSVAGADARAAAELHLEVATRRLAAAKAAFTGGE